MRWFSLMLLAAMAPAAVAADRTVTWKKIVVDKVFRSEGVAVADVNKDGQFDVLVGDFWYEGPNWKIHPIRRTKDFNDNAKSKGYYADGFRGYSECMCCWADDVNGDGWVDQIVIGFPGKPAYWYENPKSNDGPWKEHVIWPSACNETPLYVDLFGKGKKVLVMGFQPKGQQHHGQMAWFTPGSDPAKLWEMHPISEPSADDQETPGTFQFSHGLGVGDLNGDGRLDVVCTAAGMDAKKTKVRTGGWWEHPAKDDGKPWRFHPADLKDATADLVAYDVDGDGKADVISSSAHQYGIWWHQQRPSANGSPAFLKNELFKELVSETHALHCVDMDGDGLKDLVTGKRFWSHGKNEPGADKPAYLYWLKASKSADGMVRFTPTEIDNDSGVGTQFVVRDLNGDGKPDIAVSNKKGVYVFIQQ